MVSIHKHESTLTIDLDKEATVYVQVLKGAHLA